MHHRRLPPARCLLALTALLSTAACEAQLDDEFDDFTQLRDGDYGEPGQSGEPIPDEPPARTQTFDVDGGVPSVGVCDEVYAVSVEVTGPPPQVCENVPQAGLYAKALARADALTAPMSCPKGCPVYAEWLSAHAWSCSNDLGAKAAVQLSAACLSEEQAPPSSLPDPLSSGAIKDTLHKTGVFDKDGQRVSESDPGPAPCDSQSEALYVYETNKTCDDIDFEHHVLAARAGAQLYDASIPCAGECERADYEELGVDWSCEGDRVRVRVLFNVVCGC